MDVMLPPYDELGRDIPELLDRSGASGLGVAVLKSGSIVWLGGWGRTSRAAAAVEVDAETVFEVGSLSKPAFAWLVMNAVRSGQLDLDRPLASYLRPDLERRPWDAITSRHVLSQSSGLLNWRFEPGQRLELTATPGTAFTYSGEAVVQLQSVLEDVTGEALESHAQRLLFVPLAMRSSTFLWNERIGRRLADGHTELGEPVEPFGARIGRPLRAAQGDRPLELRRTSEMARLSAELFPTFPPLPVSLLPNAAGSLMSSAHDYARFVAQLLGPDRELLRAMTGPVTPVNDAVSWGLGWGLERIGEAVLFWHWGSNDLFNAFVVGDIDTGDAVVALSNGGRAMSAVARVITSLTRTRHPALSWLGEA